MKERYWKFMYQKKHRIFYLDLYREKYVLINIVLRCITALTSSASIAAWAIWKDFAYVWAFIIAVSQVISAIYEILPFKNRIIDMSALSSKWSGLYTQIEHEWYLIQNEEISDNDINDLITKYTQAWDAIDDNFFKNDVLPKNIRIENKSKEATKNYFAYNF